MSGNPTAGARRLATVVLPLPGRPETTKKGLVVNERANP
jgi:hypothetical protein